MTGRVLDFLLPTGCVSCRSWIPTRSGDEAVVIVCRRCRSRLATASWPRCPRCHAPRGTGRDPAPDCLECRDWPPELARARYAHLLDGPAMDLVHGLKYEGWRELADIMGRAMARTARAELDGTSSVEADRPVLVVPVPTTDRRMRDRGYNQARLLAEVVASELGRPLAEALHRGRAPSSQTTLSPRERRENVRGAFRIASCREGPAAGPEERPADPEDRPADSRKPTGRDILLVDDVLTTGATAGEAARTLAAAGAASVQLLTFARALQSAMGGDRTAA